LIFADASTRDVKVGKEITDALMIHLQSCVEPSSDSGNVEETVQDLLVEAAAVTATYNMVSRFLVSLDVGCMSDNDVPWPIDRKEVRCVFFFSIHISPNISQHFVTIPESNHTIHAVTITSSPSSPWIVFANSLVTNLSMWGYLIPHLIHDSPDSRTGKPHSPYNILIHSQRGHGKSTLPNEPTTIPSLASDIMRLLSHLNISTPIQAIVGVSQGGAAALAFAQMYPERTRSVVACDTAAITPSGNREAWAGRIGMVYGGVSPDSILREGVKTGEVGRGSEYSVKVGMGKLGVATVSRWFPMPSKCADGETEHANRAKWLREMVEKTPVDGFVAGAGALSNYDLLDSQSSFLTCHFRNSSHDAQEVELLTLGYFSTARLSMYCSWREV
jgi:pimeloyl-ACP methyl ester carboxylesterase